MKLPYYTFVPAKEAQDSKGHPNGKYIIKAKWLRVIMKRGW